MTAQTQNTPFFTCCKVENLENHHKITAHFEAVIPLGDHDDLEAHVEKLGQEFKRNLYQHALKAADQRVAELAQLANPDLQKWGTVPFTFVARFGKVKIQRQRLRNPKAGKSMIPSAISWKIAQNRHITQAVADQACRDSQKESYREATEQLRNVSGQESFLSTTTIWNLKQKKGKELQKQQDAFIENVVKNHGEEMFEHGLLPSITLPQKTETVVTPLEEKTLTDIEKEEIDKLFFHFIPSDSVTPNQCEASTNDDAKCSKIQRKCHVEPGTISVQLDEVLTKSQEKNKKMNLTGSATIEDETGRVFYLTASSTEEILRLAGVYLMILGVTVGKRLEVLGDGAKWIDLWSGGVRGIEIVRILCWYHLCRRVYESLSGLGWEKQKKKAFERLILGALWEGKVSQAVWMLWGVRGEAKTSKRIDDLMGYLLRKRRGIVNYSERSERGLWIASTRVEKWNDLSVSNRCKRRGMSWSGPGVLSQSLYASEKRTPRLDPVSAN